MARPIPRDGRLAVERDPNWKPSDWEPYFYLVDQSIRCWTGTTSFASEARIEYIRYPRLIDITNGIDPELPSSVNYETVRIALRSYLEVSESARYERNTKETTMNP